MIVIMWPAGEHSHLDSEPSASVAGRFQLRPSALDKHAASLSKGTTPIVRYANEAVKLLCVNLLTEFLGLCQQAKEILFCC